MTEAMLWSAGLEGIWAGLARHLAQSTLFLLGVGLIALGLRHAPARTRHQLWTVALLKFVLPVSLLGAGWSRIRPIVAPDLGPGDSAAPLTWIVGLDPVSWFGDTTRYPQMGVTVWIGITLLWALGAAFVLRHAFRPGARLRVSGFDTLSGSDRDALENAARSTGLPLSRIRLTHQELMPSVRGLVHPTVWLPVRLLSELTAPQLRAVLSHERAHLERNEPRRLLLQRLVFALFFYYPPLWFVLRRLHATSELACDERAVAAGVEPRDLARALSRTLRLGLSSPAPAAALGSGHRSLLAERLDRLDSQRRYEPMPHHRLLLGLAALALLGTVLAPRVTGADDPKPPKADVLSSEAAAPESESSVGEDEVIPPRPIPESMVMPKYPEEYRSEGASGRVLLQVLISEKGQVVSATEKQGVEGYPAFTDSAIEAALQWRFEHATKDGKPVAMEVILPIQFRLD